MAIVPTCVSERIQITQSFVCPGYGGSPGGYTNTQHCVWPPHVQTCSAVCAGCNKAWSLPRPKTFRPPGSGATAAARAAAAAAGGAR